MIKVRIGCETFEETKRPTFMSDNEQHTVLVWENRAVLVPPSQLVMITGEEE